MEAHVLEERLRDYEQVVDSMQCGLVVEDPDGTLIFVNQRLLDWLGYQRFEVEGKPGHLLLSPEIKSLWQEDLDASLAGDMRARLFALRRKDGTTFPALSIPQVAHDEQGEIESFYSVVVDLGSVLTAKPMGSGGVDVSGALARIAVELHTISTATSVGADRALPLGHPSLSELSPREAEVLALLVAGERVAAISSRLHISQHTVRNHLKSMYRKIGVGNQAELIAHVRALGDAPGAPAPA